MIHSLRVILACCVCLFLVSCVSHNELLQDSSGAEGRALFGGYTSLETPFAFTSDLEDKFAPVPFPPEAIGEILSVSLNVDGTTGILGGRNSLGLVAMAFQLDVETNTLTPISSVTTDDLFNSVAISADGTKGLLGGNDSAVLGIVYAVDTATATATPVPGVGPSPFVFSTFNSVALNGDGTKGLAGGEEPLDTSPLAFSIDLTGAPSSAEITLYPSGVTNSVAIDETGATGLIGGKNISTPSHGLHKVVGTTPTTITLTGADTGEEILGVAISRSGTVGIAGGHNDTEARAYTVSMTGTPSTTEIPGMSADASINSVAIDTAGEKGLLGGETLAGAPEAFVVDIGTSSAITLTGLPAEGAIVSVEIQDIGRSGILGGYKIDGTDQLPLALLVTGILGDDPVVTELTLAGSAHAGSIQSVSVDQLFPMLDHIATAGLEGNNWTLADYLNENASSTAAYLLPDALAGNLPTALEKVSPLRNAAALFSASNTFFSIAQGVSQRARDARQFRRLQEKEQKEFALLAAKNGDYCTVTNCPREIRLNDLWLEVIGLIADQSKQDETPGFDPQSVGVLVAYDVQKTKNFRGGLGLAYAYTSVDFDQGTGNSYVNQEYLTVYGFWNRHDLYANLACWFGLFQTNQERKMDLKGFDFRSTSYTRGYQFDPHLELGAAYDIKDGTWIVEPFVMVDWVHNWQDAYKEYSSSAFKFFQQRLHASMLRTEAGLRLYQEFGFSAWNLVLQEALTYIYKDTYSLGDVKGFLIGAPGTLVLNTFTDSNSFGSVGFSMLFDPKRPKYPSGRIGYKGEFGSCYRSHQLNASCQWSF